MSFIEGTARDQASLLPPCAEDHVAPDALVRVVDAFLSSLNFVDLGFVRAVAAATGRPGITVTLAFFPIEQLILEPGAAVIRWACHLARQLRHGAHGEPFDCQTSLPCFNA